MAKDNYFVGRQPIYNRKNDVVAYELLYRDADTSSARITDGDLATSEVIINTFMDIGLEPLVGNHTAFINLTRKFIVGEHPLPLLNKNVVLEILEDIQIDEEVIAGARHLAKKGYTIALDDFKFSPEMVPLLEIAHIVKVDVLGMDPETVKMQVRQLRYYNVKLLAEKVEDHAMLELCRELGFELFQGYFFCKPNIIKSKSPPANRLVVLNLLSQLQDPEVEIDDLEDLVVQDVTLTYRLLRYINSAYFGLSKKVESVHRALIFIGLKTIRNWVSLLIMARIDDKPRELMVTALNRAKMCQLLGEANGSMDGDIYFTVGLFSVLDAMMDRPMEDLLAELPFANEVKSALLRHDGILGETLQQVLEYEKGNWEFLMEQEQEPTTFIGAYMNALQWTSETLQALAH